MTKSNIDYLQCVTCKRQFSPQEVDYTCPDCGPLQGTLDVIYNIKQVKKKISRQALAVNTEASHWRYLPLLPVDQPEYIQPLHVGWTPLYHHKRINKLLDLPNLYLKDDSGNATASYKDRASSVAIVKALEKGVSAIAAASSGNAAASIAAFAASAGLPCHIFVPKAIPEAKLAQLRAFNAFIELVDGPYDKVFELCMRESRRKGWYNRNTAINPYLAEGKKTGALEICEQLNWRAPDVVLVPVGDGCIISGVWKGFKDLYHLGFIETLPRLVGVQAEGSAPLVKAFREGKKRAEMLKVHTIADSISVGFPRDQVKALRAVHQSGGTFISVSDMEILDAIRFLAANGGIFAEPAAAAAFAGLRRLLKDKKITPEQTTVVMLTGSGLKDIKAIEKSI
ncbi:MAG TPA: threonine synthase [Calditrichaeota bacterium]|nr:threonine synthase [Calditrichota bacterium]